MDSQYRIGLHRCYMLRGQAVATPGQEFPKRSFSRFRRDPQ
jgi:hypothetical protein